MSRRVIVGRFVDGQIDKQVHYFLVVMRRSLQVIDSGKKIPGMVNPVQISYDRPPQQAHPVFLRLAKLVGPPMTVHRHFFHFARSIDRNPAADSVQQLQSFLNDPRNVEWINRDLNVFRNNLAHMLRPGLIKVPVIGREESIRSSRGSMV